jgi:ABC-type Zn2+ transport system substrate-binding protein/surface adhesin
LINCIKFLIGLISCGNYAQITENADHHQNEGHGHDDAVSDHHHDNEHEHQDNEEDECCDEIVNNLYASLIKYELKHKAVEIPVFQQLYQVYAVDFLTEAFNQKIVSFFYANLPLPVSGYHIHIFIQSFLI